MLISNIIIKMKNLSLRILGMLVYGFSLKMTRWSVLFLLPKSLYYIYHLKHLYSASKNVTMFWTTQLEETIFVKTKQNKPNEIDKKCQTWKRYCEVCSSLSFLFLIILFFLFSAGSGSCRVCRGRSCSYLLSSWKNYQTGAHTCTGTHKWVLWLIASFYLVFSH